MDIWNGQEGRQGAPLPLFQSSILPLFLDSKFQVPGLKRGWSTIPYINLSRDQVISNRYKEPGSRGDRMLATLALIAILPMLNCLFMRFLFASLSMPLVIKEKEVFQGNLACFYSKKGQWLIKHEHTSEKNIVFFARMSLAGAPPCRVLAIACDQNYRYMKQDENKPSSSPYKSRVVQLHPFQLNCLLAICNCQKARLSIAESNEPGSRDGKLLITIALITFHRSGEGVKNCNCFWFLFLRCMFSQLYLDNLTAILKAILNWKLHLICQRDRTRTYVTKLYQTVFYVKIL